ncbi:enoyl-CoA hydratase/carnithine racemase [Nocardioides sp. J9]|uniref:enoyl-CoA hydratase/isomerase family protein n=1 Tax=Nocardioides sp. J9 TaxID=935844 RepID=UPI0011AC1AD3|nr:enoyl-CoA hydratase-related protein [Nocardioides sp. J9]TWG98580.1 enoyl-CoA hydratase/carnithine racemase [Nocardioides sp. J9]
MADESVGRIVSGVDDRGVATLVLSNPARRNAITGRMRRAIEQLLEEWEEDSTVRVVVASGEGGRSFCSGLDLAEEASREHRDLAQDLRRFWGAWQRFTKPVIARIEGHCIGGGVLTALHADLRYCSQESIFSIPAARLGLPFGFDSAQPVVEAIGRARATELVLTARSFDAQDALRLGLVSQVVPAEELASVVDQLAADIAENAPLTVRAAKAGIREAARDAGDRDLAAVDRFVAAARSSQDLLEGRAARRERRAPRFEGK